MASFHYIALNPQQKELSGVIEASDESAARQNLNKLGLSIISMNAIAAAPTAKTSGKNTYEFEAFDREGKKVVGTIVAESPTKAFGRLFGEYQLNVLALFHATAGSSEKEEARKKGVNELRQEYEQSFGEKVKAAAQQEQAAQAFEQERSELMEKVNFTMQKIESFLAQFTTELKPEERNIIQDYLNQLVRIKGSTNLEHIRTTCEKMLEHIQQQELFLHEEQRLKESSKLKVETQELLTDLKRTGLQKDIDMVKTARGWENTPWLRPLAHLILHFSHANNPELRKLMIEIKTVHQHIRSYLKFLIAGKSMILRREAWESIKTLWEEKKRLSFQLHALKEKQRKMAAAARSPAELTENLAMMSGWVLSFYLAAYILAYPFTIKNFGLAHVPRSFAFYQSHFAAPITLFLFLAYGTMTIRRWWLANSVTAPFILYPLSLFLFLLMVINLL